VNPGLAGGGLSCGILAAGIVTGIAGINSPAADLGMIIGPFQVMARENYKLIQ